MNVEFAQLKRQYEKHQGEYEEAALRVLRSGWYILGNELREFEAQYAAYHNIKHCIGVNSGLDALTLAVRALGIGKGDEVIVPANTFIATALAISESGARPVFVEPDEFFGLDSKLIESAVTPQTKAIIPVHLYGQPCDMRKISEIADRHGLYIVEDCAQAHGATFEGQKVGTFGDIACFSFYPMKPIGAFGDAGAVITNSDELAEKMFMLRNYGSRIKYKHELIGVNTRLDEMQAAILKINLSHVEAGNAERRKIAEQYLTEITNPKIVLPKTRPEATHVYHVFALRCRERSELQKFLSDNGIHTQIHYPIPCPLAGCYTEAGFKPGDFQTAEILAKEELSLPIYVGMPDEEISWVIDKINRF